MHRDDFEPFLSEVGDESLPPATRLGSLAYLQARESFLDEEVGMFLDETRERLTLLIAEEAEPVPKKKRSSIR